MSDNDMGTMVRKVPVSDDLVSKYALPIPYQNSSFPDIPSFVPSRFPAESFCRIVRAYLLLRVSPSLVEEETSALTKRQRNHASIQESV